MPSIVDKYKLPQKYDRRRKLSEEQKDEIRHKYETGLYSLRILAAEYKVSKKLILVTVNPESAQKSKDRMKEHWRDYRMTKEQAAAYRRNLRSYKKELMTAGKLQEVCE